MTETIEITKDIATRITIITIEAQVIIETFIIEIELTVTTETITIIDTTIVNQARDTQTAVTQDSIQRTTESKPRNYSQNNNIFEEYYLQRNKTYTTN